MIDKIKLNDIKEGLENSKKNLDDIAFLGEKDNLALAVFLVGKKLNEVIQYINDKGI